MSEGGLLHHFPSKATLLELLIERTVTQHDASPVREASRTGLNWGQVYVKAAFA